jgi:hypothetical protein
MDVPLVGCGLVGTYLRLCLLATAQSVTVLIVGGESRSDLHLPLLFLPHQSLSVPATYCLRIGLQILDIMACRPVARQRPVNSNRVRVFSLRSVPRCSKQGQLVSQELVVGWWVSELVRQLLRVSRCELLLLEAGNWGTGTVREPSGRGTSNVGSRNQATTVKTWLWN